MSMICPFMQDILGAGARMQLQMESSVLVLSLLITMVTICLLIIV